MASRIPQDRGGTRMSRIGRHETRMSRIKAHGTRISRIKVHETRISRTQTTGRGSRGSKHGTRIPRIRSVFPEDSASTRKNSGRNKVKAADFATAPHRSVEIHGISGGRRLALRCGMDSAASSPLLLEDVTKVAIGAFFDVYNEHSGFPEYVLRRSLAIALIELGLVVHQEVRLPVWFRGQQVATFRADLILEPGVIIEVKVAPEIQAFHKAQVLHYLKATGLQVGLVFNFGPRPQFARVVYQAARQRAPFVMSPEADRTSKDPGKE